MYIIKMSISALDKNTVKFLKTSQVITSVSFAVKELVENSLDANAKNIEVNLSDDGLTHIEVKDDGNGIAKEDAPFMALASYTSKIKYFEDLEKLHTYGFRGEALQALCQVSQLTIITRANNEEIATSYIIDSKGNIEKSELCHRSVGTTVQVKGLFKNMPVRRQTLLNSRRANQDLKYMEALLKSFGIIQPCLRITYRLNKKIVFIKSSANSLTESMTNVLGKDMASSLEWIEENCSEGRIQLMLPKKDLTDTTLICHPGHQFMFINNRIIVYKEIEKLLSNMIHEYYFNKGITISKKCLFFLNIIVEPSNLDINLEPNKTKGFLKNERKIIEFVEKTVMKFYQLERPQEEEVENIYSLDDKSDCVSNVIDNETEWPACKKRKFDFKEKASVDNSVDTLNCYSDRNKGIAEKDILNMPISNLKEPILSETDSNSDNEISHKERRSIASKRTKESVPNSVKFSSNKRLSNEIEVNKEIPQTIFPIDTETFSQLPVVDLGEEFSQLSSEKSHGNLQSNTSFSKLSDETESLLADVDLDDYFSLNKEQDESKSILKQSTLTLNTSKNGELVLDVDKDSFVNQISPSPNSWSRGHVSGLMAGTDVKVLGSNEEDLKPNSLTGFNIFFSQVRPRLVTENPEMSVPQIANLLTTRWREMSCERKAHYHEMAEEKMKREELQSKKAKKEKQDSEKNKKRLLKMLKIMKAKNANKGNETLRARTTAPMETNIQKITEKFYKTKNPKQNIIIGPVKPSIWIVKISSQFCLLDVAKMFRKLNFTDHNSNETNAESLEALLRRWTLENDDMSILHFINQES